MERNFLRNYKGYKIFEQSAEDPSNINMKRITVKNTDIDFPFDFTDPSAINKAIEEAKTLINKLPGKQKDPVSESDIPSTPIVADPAPVRKCRICGCTDDNCEQCIKKTGKPCTWVEDDLCSACVEEPEIKVVDNRAAQISSDNIPQETVENIPAGDSFFFQQLATFGDVDLTMRVMKVNGRFTIGIKPGMKMRGMKQLNITGTPEEFDREFISVIMPRVKATPGLMITEADLKDAGKKSNKDEENAKAKPPKAAVKVSKPKAQKKAKPVKDPKPKKQPEKKSGAKDLKKMAKKKEESTPASDPKPAVVEMTLL